MPWGEHGKDAISSWTELTDIYGRVYADSSPDPLDDPKVETIVELLYRIWVSHLRRHT
jgi:hypothetical protein